MDVYSIVLTYSRCLCFLIVNMMDRSRDTIEETAESVNHKTKVHRSPVLPNRLKVIMMFLPCQLKLCSRFRVILHEF